HQTAVEVHGSGGGSVEDDLSVVYHQRPVRPRCGLEVVGHFYYLLRKRVDERVNVTSPPEVEQRRGFVEHNDPRIDGEHAREGKQLTLTSRERMHRDVRVVPKSDLVER